MHYFPGRWFVLAHFDVFTPGLKKQSKQIFSFLQTINRVGSNEFSDFSNVQFVNISGAVKSVDSSGGMITYRPQIQYRFSCLYPMQYLLNNTELGVWVYSVWGLQSTCNVAAYHGVLFDACTDFSSTQIRSEPRHQRQQWNLPQHAQHASLPSNGLSSWTESDRECSSHSPNLILCLFYVQQDDQYRQALLMPPTGLNLKTKIYVAVKATNLTERY